MKAPTVLPAKIETDYVRAIGGGWVDVNNVTGQGGWNISANLSAGQSFICWIGASSNGWIGSPYIVDHFNQNTQVFAAVAASGSGKSITARYLYRFNPD